MVARMPTATCPPAARPRRRTLGWADVVAARKKGRSEGNGGRMGYDAQLDLRFAFAHARPRESDAEMGQRSPLSRGAAARGARLTLRGNVRGRRLCIPRAELGVRDYACGKREFDAEWGYGRVRVSIRIEFSAGVVGPERLRKDTAGTTHPVCHAGHAAMRPRGGAGSGQWVMLPPPPLRVDGGRENEREMPVRRGNGEAARLAT